MQPFIWWIVVGLILIGSEVITGTLYLFFIGLACLITSVLAYYDFSFLAQTILFTLLSLFSVYVVYIKNKSKSKSKITINSDSNSNNLDIGQVVNVEHWNKGITTVHYRGCRWQAKYYDDNIDAAKTGRHTIVSMQGNILIIKP